MPAAQAVARTMKATVLARAMNGIVAMLETVGMNDHPGCKETPARVVKAFQEMTAGYQDDPAAILSKIFDCDSDELVIVDGIDFVSLCEHHLLPFTGKATVAYLPNKKVVGLSKIPRLVECFARRLQLQEQLTNQIAHALNAHPDLAVRGAACIIEASHSCMSCRGVRKAGATMITSAMLGEFRENPTLRGELLSLRRRS